MPAHLEPGPDHPITITPHEGRVVVRSGDRVLVDTTRALELAEASYPVALYLPREDADLDALERTEHSTHCPYKGDAAYYSVPGVEGGENAVWTYEQPHAAVAAIEGHLAFYPGRVDIEA